jgi:PEP-CTERM motif
MKHKSNFVIAFALTALSTFPLLAEDVVPNFSTAPAGWVTDRYAPNSFTLLPTFQGQDNVLQIGISSADALNNRPAPYQSTFYNTQGEKFAVNSGPNTASVLLYVPTAWADPTSGNVRTDMWLQTTDGSNRASSYPIVGFTNYGGYVGFRGYDSTNLNSANIGTWTDFTSAAVNYGAWNKLSISYTAGQLQYSINDVVQETLTSGVPLGDPITDVFLQAYNFGDPSLHANAVDYTVQYANTPEPSTFGLIGIGLIGCAYVGRRKRAVV